ncbi:MAG TPA: hypothetical protein VFI75_00055 [Candidatus Acidoferrum sp.]|nr:hypothetical protein [Candidatus Acidoferrum sp.]
MLLWFADESFGCNEFDAEGFGTGLSGCWLTAGGGERTDKMSAKSANRFEKVQFFTGVLSSGYKAPATAYSNLAATR